MEFRPCIDIHNGKVKQIVGSTLSDTNDFARENFVSQKGAEYYADLYRENNLPGGHVIILNGKDSPYYEATRNEALKALAAYPNALMIGGGINDTNAEEYIKAGASHVIVTSFVFKDGLINMDNLEKLESAVGKERIVLDLSCKKIEGVYKVVTDRWQNITKEELRPELFDSLGKHCDEFLVHAVDSEGKSAGIDEKLIENLSKIDHTITYAGGVSSYEDIRRLSKLGKGRVNFTVGSRLDLFGGELSIGEILKCIR